MQAQLYIAADAEVSVEGIHHALKSAGVRFGLQANAVEEALSNRAVPITIAEGVPAKPGTDDTLEFHLSRHLLDTEVCLGIRDDLHRKSEIPSVEAGQPIVTRTAGTPGTSGTDVFGNVVNPPPVLRYDLRALSGTEVTDDGGTVVAAITGRPRLQQDGRIYRFQAQPSYIHTGDVTMEVGHLTFQGDVTVYGNVMEGTSITATGSIDIHGNAIGPQIQAGQSIRVSGNVIQSKLTSGIERLFWQQLTPVLDKISLQLSELTDVLGQLNDRGQLAQLPFPKIASRVISLRVADYPETLQILQKLLNPQKNKTPLPAGADELRPLVQSLVPEQWTDLHSLQRLAAQVFKTKKDTEDMADISADIFLSYALNAKILSAGNIIVEGQGCIHSALEAGGEVKVQGKLRGGSVIAPKHIFAREVGSDAGALTTLSTGSRGRIEVDKAHENTLFAIGKSTRKLTEPIAKTRATIDAEGRVQLLSRH